MTHEEAVVLLPEHLQGRLAGEVRSAVEEHAASCAECRALAELYPILDEGFRAEEAEETGRHPEVDALVDFALGRATDLAARAGGVAAHVEACSACAAEVDAVRTGQAEALGAEEGARRRVPWRWSLRAALTSPLAAPLAAGIVLLLLTYPAFLGLRELPAVRARTEALLSEREASEARIEELARAFEASEGQRRRLSSWTGAIAVPLLAAPLRSGGAGETAIPVADGQPFVCLVVDPGVPEEDGGGTTYRVEAAGPAGAPAWSVEIGAVELRRQLAAAGSLAFLVPSEKLPPASYRLRIVRRDDAGERPILEVPFAVVRSE